MCESKRESDRSVFGNDVNTHVSIMTSQTLVNGVDGAADRVVEN